MIRHFVLENSVQLDSSIRCHHEFFYTKRRSVKSPATAEHGRTHTVTVRFLIEDQRFSEEPSLQGDFGTAEVLPFLILPFDKVIDSRVLFPSEQSETG